jgi:hypothetical protein
MSATSLQTEVEPQGHTPGPWQPVRNRNNGRFHVACETHVITETFKNEANANLIAAAPDLLALLRQAVVTVAFVENTSSAGTNRANSKKLRLEIEAAIARADGR